MKPQPNQQQLLTSTLAHLGLLIRQAGLYGISHNVTISALNTTTQTINQFLSTHKSLAISISNSDLIINGETSPEINTAGLNLLERLNHYKITGLTITPPFALPELMQLTKLLNTPPQELQAQGGIHKLLKSSPIPGITIPPLSTTHSPLTTNHPEHSTAATSTTWDLDLEPTQAHPTQIQLTNLTNTLSQHFNQPLPPPDTTSQLSHLNTLLNLAEDSIRRHIETLSHNITTTNQLIANPTTTPIQLLQTLQQAWRDILAQIAELHQEIAQPLTVTSGVLQMICQGDLGPLTPEQDTLLNLAYDSAQRANHLITHLHTIVGLPTTLTPQNQFISTIAH